MIYKFNIIEKILLNNDIIPHPFADIGSNVGLAKALGVAVKLRITDQLSSQPKNISAIAKGAGVSEKGVELILNCLNAMGYTEKAANDFRFTKRGIKMLDKSSPKNMLYFIEFCDWIFNSFSTLAETIKNGNPSRIYPEHFSSDYEWEIFSRAMIDLARTNVKEVTSKIKLHKEAHNLMDIGGSHGLYSIALCEKNENLCASILDLDPVKKYTIECINKKNMSERVSFKPCDFMKDDLLTNQDGALLFNIIHGFTPEQNTALLKKIYNSFNKSGQLFILDQIKNIEGKSQLSLATTSYMAINLFHHANGNTYSFNEIKMWCDSVGFHSTKLTKLNAPGFGIISCEK